ncbi:MAG: hypothetical protein ABWZ83_08445 [Mesorhizobium sp.]|jgi:hypothetical protein
MTDTKMFVIGDSESGLYLIKTNPVKIVRITKAAIQQYATAHNKTYEEVFGLLAARTRRIVNLGQANPPPLPDDPSFFETLGLAVGSGTTVSEAEFCFIADVDNALYQSSRDKIDPIKDALTRLNTGPAGFEDADFDK